jgi:hypothetical protein
MRIEERHVPAPAHQIDLIGNAAEAAARAVADGSR